MTLRREAMKQWASWAKTGVVLLAFAAGVVVLMFWLSGKFSPKVPGASSAQATEASTADRHVAMVRIVTRPLSESAVGSIRAVHETSIGSKLLARVIDIKLKAGQKVNKGHVLVRLDDTDLRAKLEQAKAAVRSLDAVRRQTLADEQRLRQLVETRAVSRQDYERAQTAMHTAEADFLRAQETVKEVQSLVDAATVESPIDGTVIDKKVDVGDMVAPGQILLTLYDPARMQMVASVRESLTRRLRVGQEIGVAIDGLNKQCSGTVSEIVPEAQSASRSFQVKVTGPCPTGIYSGMFGRITIPLDEERIPAIPQGSVRKVGQLELVEVVVDGKATQRAIRTGRYLGDVVDGDGNELKDQVEVLSGLQPGEQIVVQAAAARAAANCPAPGSQSTPTEEARHD